MQRPHLVNPIGQHTTRTAPRRVATETFLPGAQRAQAEARRAPVGPSRSPSRPTEQRPMHWGTRLPRPPLREPAGSLLAFGIEDSRNAQFGIEGDPLLHLDHRQLVCNRCLCGLQGPRASPPASQAAKGFSYCCCSLPSEASQPAHNTRTVPLNPWPAAVLGWHGASNAAADLADLGCLTLDA